MTHDCGEIIVALKELGSDCDVPRSVKSRIDQTITTLETPQATRLKLNKALHDLETLGEDSNLQPMTRTALMGVLSLIESKASALH